MRFKFHATQVALLSFIFKLGDCPSCATKQFLVLSINGARVFVKVLIIKVWLLSFLFIY